MIGGGHHTIRNILGTNDASFNDGTGIADGAIATAKLADDSVTGQKLDTASILLATSTPSGNSDSTGSWADWGASTTVAVPTWANRALIIASIEGFFGVSSDAVCNTRVVIGSDTGSTSGHIGITVQENNNLGTHTWSDYITLTGTGSVTLKNQVIETSGTGALRVSTTSRFSWTIIFLAA